MNIKDKMVELKDRSINFVKEHKYDIMVIGLYTTVDLAFYCVGRRDGRTKRDRYWQKELDGYINNEYQIDTIYRKLLLAYTRIDNNDLYSKIKKCYCFI